MLIRPMQNELGKQSSSLTKFASYKKPVEHDLV